MTTKAELVAWLKSTNTTRVVLVEIQNVIVYDHPPIPGGTTPANGSTKTFYLSNKPYASTTRLYDACISGGVSFTESISLTGSPTIGYGDIEVFNAIDSDRKGERDWWLRCIWDAKLVNILIGDVAWAYADFYNIFTGTVRGIDSKGRTSLNLILTDRMQELNVAVSDTVLGGTTTAKDKLVPLTFGECFNITPLLADPTVPSYKVHTGRIERIIEVRDNGAPVSFSGNISTANLNAGTFALTYPPYGTITCSVQGSAPGGVYRQYVGEIIRHILTSYGRQLSDANYIDNASFTAFDATNSSKAQAGIYLEGRENVLDVCNRLANSVGAYVTLGLDGKFRLTQLKADITGITPDFVVTQTDMETNSFVVREKVPVQGSVKLSYCKNWTVQPSGLAAGLVAPNVSVLGYENYYVSNFDQTTLTQYGQTKEPPAKETLLITETSGVTTITDATKECDRLVALYKTPRFIYSATYFSHMLVAEIGQTIQITHPRYGLGSGKIGTIVEINRDWLKGRVTLGVFI
jgi:hypothetical protein